MVVAEVLGQNPAKMILVQHDNVVQALTADGLDEALDIRRLPRRALGKKRKSFGIQVDGVFGMDRVEKKLERPWKLEIIRDQRLTTVVGRAIREIPANKSFRRQLKQSRSAELVVMSTTNGDI
jgi:hypothetical protein